jgi:hypothetical protein
LVGDDMKTKFKVGDSVKYVSVGMFGNETRNWQKEAHLNINDVCKIEYIDLSGYLHLKGHSYVHHPDHFELVENDYPKFKIGDKVKYIQESLYEKSRGLILNNIYVIHDIDQHNYIQLDVYNKYYWHSPTRFELVKEEELTPESALDWSIKKWEYVVENNGSDAYVYRNVPGTEGFYWYCGLCQYYRNHHFDNCHDCPLKDEYTDCCKEFDNWRDCQTPANAQVLLDWHFKNGDVVSIIELQAGQLMTLKNDKFTIQMTAISPDFKENFKLYEEPEYKVGDKYICIKDFYGYNKVGDILSIKEIWEDAIIFDTNVYKCKSDFNNYFRPYTKEDEQIDAIKGSIKKWEDIVGFGGTDEGSANCDLCKTYKIRLFSCGECPVHKKTDNGCGDTPYEKWLKHHDSNHSKHNKREILCFECETIAQDEVDFLKGLLPKEKKKNSLTLSVDIEYTDRMKDWIKTIHEATILYGLPEGSPEDNVPIKGVSRLRALKEELEKKLTLKEAIDLSIKKWEWIVSHNGKMDTTELLKDIPELKLKTNLGDAYCGLCKYFDNSGDCHGCPLRGGDYCHRYFQKWNGGEVDDSLKWAVKLLNVIYCIKENYEAGYYNDIEKGHA